MLTSCSNDKNYLIKSSKWLLGNWEYTTKNGKITETWRKKNDSVFIGNSFYIQNKDTLHYEQHFLEQKGEDLFLFVAIKGQNNNEFVRYNLVTMEENQVTFETKTENYPKNIQYLKKDKKHLELLLNGKNDSVKMEENYLFIKIK